MGLFDFFKKPKREQIIVKSGTTNNMEQNCIKTTPIKKGVVKTLNVSTTIANIEKAKNRFIAIDFETTGLSPYSDRIIEVGAAIFENGTLTETAELVV